MDPNDREEVLYSTLRYDSPNSHAISREPLLPQLQLWYFHCLACIQYVDARRAMLQTLEDDADDVDDGGVWFQQHGVIAHTVPQSIACFERYVPWLYHFMIW